MKRKEEKNKKLKEAMKKASKIKKGLLAMKVALTLLWKPLIAFLLISVLMTTVVKIVENIFAQNTPTQIYEDLEIEDLSDFIVIKGDNENGYHLEFVEDADEKLEKTAENLEKKAGVKSVDKELLKKMIKAEVLSQYPNLGGKISDQENQFQGNVNIRRVTPNKEVGEMKDTSLGEEVIEDIVNIENDVESEDDSNSTKKKYVIGIMAAHSKDSPGGRSPIPEGKEEELKDQQLKEEEMTIKVANYIEQIFSIYSNIKVVQIGSTIDNPNIPDKGRLKAAKEAKVDALIGINFDATGDGKEYNGTNGIRISYNSDGGSEKAKELGEILKEKVSNSMGLSTKLDENKKSTVLGTKEDPFVSLNIHGGYLTSDKDFAVIGTDSGLQKYAKGVVDGILKFYGIRNIGYGPIVVGTRKISSTIDSNIYNLKYVPMDVLENDIENDTQKAMQEFSLDEDKNLVTATWTFEETGMKMKKSPTALDYRKVIDKYSMPIEYLLFFYIDTNQKSFVSNLADLAINSEFIITVQDNITTTKVTTIKTTTTNSTLTVKRETDKDGKVTWSKPNTTTTQTTTTPEEKIFEYWNSKIELTYADTWFVKFKSNFIPQNMQSGNRGMSGKVNIKETQSESTGIQSEYRSATTDNATESYQDEITTSITTKINSISNQYELGEKEVEPAEEKFIKIFNDEEEGAKGLVKRGWLLDLLKNNSKTANMVDLTKYLMYKATGENLGVITFDFNQYKENTFNNMSTGLAGGLSLKTTMFTKDVFKQALQAYYEKTNNLDFYNNFLSKVDELYDASVANNVNPELVVITAKAEGNFSEAGGSYNYWGVGVPNGASSGYSYSSLADGIAGYAHYIQKYETGHFADTIKQRYEERMAAGCDPLGYGLPGTLSGMQSLYSYLGKHEYGSSGAGGYYYMDPARAGVTKIYTTHEEFLTKCKDSGLPEHAEGTETTVWEQGQYTAWQVEIKLKTWQDIFGEFGSLQTSGNYNQADIQELINLSDAEAWSLITGGRYTSRPTSSIAVDLATITVPIRVWENPNDPNNMSITSDQMTLQVNRCLTGIFEAFFKDLYEQVPNFVIKKSSGEYGGYRQDSITSGHTYGAAFDLNWSTNGNGYSGWGSRPAYSKSEWEDLPESHEKYEIIYEDSPIVQLAHRYTFSWGGEWRTSYDMMHFSFIGDVSRAGLQSKFGK